jgi:phosphocarrier protein HPr
MQKIEVKITNALGVHARTAAKIVQLASRFSCSVRLAVRGRSANARSIVAVMLLAAAVGSTITIETSGPDEKEAIDALTDLVAGGSGRSLRWRHFAGPATASNPRHGTPT